MGNSGSAAKGDYMPVLSKAEIEKLSDVERHFIRKIEEENLIRIKKVKKTKFKSRVFGLSITAGVFAIYFYTMYAIRQETFLDFVEDEKPKKTA